MPAQEKTRQPSDFARHSIVLILLGINSSLYPPSL
jgi:hypothetical protein